MLRERTQLYVSKIDLKVRRIHSQTHLDHEKQTLKDSEVWEACFRWLRYEEKLEPCGKRWSHPYVATISPIYLNLLSDKLKVCSTLPQKYLHGDDSDNKIFVEKPVLSASGKTEIEYYPSEYTWVVKYGETSHSMEEVGRCIGAILSNLKEILEITELKDIKSEQNIKTVLQAFQKYSTLLPCNAWDPNERMDPLGGSDDQVYLWDAEPFDPFKSAGHEKIGGNLVKDIRGKLKYYSSDFTDYFKVDVLQTLASTIFLFFAIVTPLITFGGLSGDMTDNHIGTIESILGGCLCGVVFALFSGQPMIIISQTGPMLIFTKILYQFSEQQNLNFMEFRLWVSIWIGVICAIVVVFGWSKYVRFITRFTEESFATLIAMIFLVEGIKKILSGGNPIADFDIEKAKCGNETVMVEIKGCMAKHDLCADDFPVDNYNACQGQVNYFSICLSVLTLFLAVVFRKTREGHLFTTKIRETITSFGVITAILIAFLIDRKADLPTLKLNIPTSIEVTDPEKRNWLIPLSMDFYSIAMAIPAAFVATILIILDQQITAVIVNRPDNKLKKGYGYHLDLLCIAVLMPICGLFGLPWYVAATVESITHVNALKYFNTGKVKIPGVQPKFAGVIEQRLTGLLIFSLVGCSIKMAPYLKLIPMPVLYGVFVYMGIFALMGQQLVERIILFVQPVKHQPDRLYLRYVPLKKVHLFTIIQVVCFALLWAIKSNKSTSIGFPVMILVIVFVRVLLNKLFTEKELKLLDS